MPRPAKAVADGLTKKGFLTKGGDHTYYYLHVGGKKTIVRTKISLGEKEIDDQLLSLMAKQVKLTKGRFLELVDCPLTFDEYVKLLRDAGHIGKVGV